MPRFGVLEHRSQGLAGSATWGPGGAVEWAAGPGSPHSHPASEHGCEQTEATALPKQCGDLVYLPLGVPQPLGSTYSKVRGAQERAPCVAPAFLMR